MIAVPEISFVQFHPFTISSAPHQEYNTIHMKAFGKWTKRLNELAGRAGGWEICEGSHGWRVPIYSGLARSEPAGPQEKSKMVL